MTEDEWSDEYVKEAEETTFECDAKVSEAKVEERTLPDGKPAKYLMLSLTPTSYEGDVFTSQYKIAKQKNGKWIHFLKGLRACGVTESGPGALVGKEFHWRRVLIKSFKGNDGEEVEVSALIPTKLISSTPTESATPTTAQPSQEPALDAVTQRVFDLIRTKGATTRPEIQKETGISMPMVLRTVSSLKDMKKIREEGGALMVA